MGNNCQCLKEKNIYTGRKLNKHRLSCTIKFHARFRSFYNDQKLLITFDYFDEQINNSLYITLEIMTNSTLFSFLTHKYQIFKQKP